MSTRPARPARPGKHARTGPGEDHAARLDAVELHARDGGRLFQQRV